jgi:hypothetical protein
VYGGFRFYWVSVIYVCGGGGDDDGGGGGGDVDFDVIAEISSLIGHFYLCKERDKNHYKKL